MVLRGDAVEAENLVQHEVSQIITRIRKRGAASCVLGQLHLKDFVPAGAET